MGDVAVVLVVTGVNDNPSTCRATVTVEDNVPPVARCQDVTVQLDANGNRFDDTAGGGYSGSTDVCWYVKPYELSRTVFACTDVGDVAVVLTVTQTSMTTRRLNNATVTVKITCRR